MVDHTDHMDMHVKVFESVLASLHGSSSTDNDAAAVVVVGAIDQGTSSSRFLLFSRQGEIAVSSQVEHTQIFPPGKTGWHEHDPLAIWAKVKQCVGAVTKALGDKGYELVGSSSSSSNHDNTTGRRRAKNQPKKLVLSTIGITNQRETTIAWHRQTGLPFYNAVVWDDTRTGEVVHSLGDDKDALRDKTGLPLASYFAGTKVKWLLDHVPELQDCLAQTPEQVCFGTIDTWLVYQLTGSQLSTAGAANAGGLFVTDVTNASRWLFMDLTSQTWDAALVDQICAPHQIPIDTALPKICPSSFVYGTCHPHCGVSVLEQNVPIGAILGDQQAALFGQTAFSPGQAKNTYGTGLFLMMNTGTRAIPSTHGLLTTIAYQIGQDGPVHYALEGSVSHSGSTIQWLRDQLGIIDDAAASETLARTTDSNEGLYLVPAFSGLFAPHWRSDARACVVGMAASHHKGHLCRAALEAAAYQTKEVFDAIEIDSGVSLETLKVDGGGTNNKLLMQFQANMLQVPVVKPVVMETTSIGAAFAAGLAVGVWADLDEIQKLWAVQETFQPEMDESWRCQHWKGWKKAVSRSFGWIEEEQEDDDEFVDALSEPDEPALLFGVTGSMTATFLVAGAALWLGFMLGSTRRRS